MSLYRRRVPKDANNSATQPSAAPGTQASNAVAEPAKTNVLGQGIRVQVASNSAWDPFSTSSSAASANPLPHASNPAVASAPPIQVQPLQPSELPRPSPAASLPAQDEVRPIPAAVPADPIAIRSATPGAILLYHRCQASNPLVAHIRRVPRKEARLSCDYECSPRVSVVFVTLQFHQSRPDYAAMRMGLVDRNKYAVRLLIVQVNIEVPQDALLELTAVSLQQGHTLVCAQSAQEAAQYLELLCTLEKSEEAHSGAFSTLLGRPEPGVGVAADLLRSVRGMTKNGIAGLLQTLGSLAGVATAEVDQLCAVPGVGAKRAQKLHAIMRQPFHRPAGKSNKRKPS